ncbi:predicted membrane-associated HD superfamily hydrolase [Candidatus Vecturithrix granuli]|uniref:Predicted membrane-associated HD superfamily hydrolase n=1 Tax=Vecturithrix granuli TaxID=1499967 RepID=A0A081C3F6_VECG1|nr:predicted membrane-associated HD superfamily hydrolase [Candidatus Vecturithrix granuli]
MSANPTMKPAFPVILRLASGGMEVTWRLAWASFMMMSLAQRIFPVPAAIGTFSLAVALTFVVRSRGWRWITIIGLHVIGCLATTLYIFYAFTYRVYPFLSRMWLNTLFSAPNNFMEGVIALFTLFWAVLFWVSGIQFARRSTAYRDVCGRFDVGIGMFFGLLLFKVAIGYNGVQLQDPLTGWLILPFLLCGMVAIGSARNLDHSSKTYRAGHRLIGVVLSFTVLVVASGVILLLLLWPYFTLTAEIGYDLLQQGLQPFIPVLVAILRFLFMPRRALVSDPATTPGNGGIEAISPGETPWWTAILEKILGWGIGGLFVLIMVCMLGVGVWRLMQWLLSKTPVGERKPRQSGVLLAWLLKIPILLRLCWEWIFRCLQGYTTATQFYRVLDDWGKHSGLPRRPTETPSEYSSRLSRHFPAIQQEITLIVALFHQEVYGESTLDAQQVTMGSLALRQLRSPLHWPSRLQTWFREETDECLGTPLMYS